jgi:DNA modification methylase
MPPTSILHIGDCIAGMRDLEQVDVTITDPPFEAEAHKSRSRRSKRAARAGSRYKRELDRSPLTFEPITERQRSLVSLHIGRTTRRWALVFCQLEGAMLWRAALEAGGMRYVRTMVWYKPDGQPQFTGDRPSVGYECIVLMHGATGRLAWNGGGRKGVFKEPGRIVVPWVIERSKGGGQRAGVHETSKPLPLMDDLVQLFSAEGETICDPFAGSGQTGVAALRAGRSFVGWELDAGTATLAQRRLAGDDARGDHDQRELFPVIAPSPRNVLGPTG